MKRVVSIILFLVAFNTTGSAQDLVVTALNDSLNCKITKMERNHIYFTFLFEGKVKGTRLPKDRIVYYEKDFFPTSELTEEDLVLRRDYSRIRINVTGGYSHLVAALSDNVP